MKSMLNRITYTRGVELVEEAHIDKQPILDLILAALLRPSFLRSDQNKSRLNNEDVVKLTRSCFSETVVMRIIEVYESEFDISRGSITSLRNSGVGDNVIEAMLSKTGASVFFEPQLRSWYKIKPEVLRSGGLCSRETCLRSIPRASVGHSEADPLPSRFAFDRPCVTTLLFPFESLFLKGTGCGKGVAGGAPLQGCISIAPVKSGFTTEVSKKRLAAVRQSATQK